MPGGNSYLLGSGSISVASSAKADVFEVSASLGGDILFNRADGRKYPQQAATVDHTATIEFSTYDLSALSQSSAASPIVGASSANVVLTIAKCGGGTSMVVTLNPAVLRPISVSSGHKQLGVMRASFEAAGTAGNEPTVTWSS